MKSVKRLEIIAASLTLDKLLRQLESVGISGYSVIRNVIGRGAYGEVSTDSDFASTALSNVYVLLYCSEEELAPALDKVRPLLKKYGGVCHVSDSMQV